MSEIQDLSQRLKTVSHFKHLSPAELVSIVAAGQVKRFQRNEVLFHEGFPCAGMHVLLQGQVNICKIGPEGQESILTTLTPVIMFNEVSVLDGGENPATAVAVKDSTIWRIGCENFQELMVRFPQIAPGLLHILARRNRLMISNYGDLSFRSVQARLAKHLLEISRQGADSIDRASHPVKTIAARVVTSSEAISRSLKTFKQLKIISCTRSEIKILDARGLQDLAKTNF